MNTVALPHTLSNPMVRGPLGQSISDITPSFVKSLDADSQDSTSVKGHKMIISHKYNDLAWVTESEASKVFPPQRSDPKGCGNKDSGEEGAKRKKRNYKKTRVGVAEPFPLKLHRMLDTVEAQGLSHIVSWQPHGRAFLVYNPKAFVDVVLPQFSKQKKINSFHRQLQLYGFMRITRGPDSGAYYHERFLIGRPYLCRSMYRTKVKGLFQKPIIDPNTEPNFYAMPHLKRPTNIAKLPPFEISAGDDSCNSSLGESDSETVSKLSNQQTTSEINIGSIEPLSWSPSSFDKDAYVPIEKWNQTIGEDFCDFLSTAAILQKFMTDD